MQPCRRFMTLIGQGHLNRVEFVVWDVFRWDSSISVVVLCMRAMLPGQAYHSSQWITHLPIHCFSRLVIERKPVAPQASSIISLDANCRSQTQQNPCHTTIHKKHIDPSPAPSLTIKSALLPRPRNQPLQHSLQIRLLLRTDPVTTNLTMHHLLQIQPLNNLINTHPLPQIRLIRQH